MSSVFSSRIFYPSSIRSIAGGFASAFQTYYRIFKGGTLGLVGDVGSNMTPGALVAYNGGDIGMHDEYWATLDRWTQENTGNRGLISDLAGHFASTWGGNERNLAERLKSFVFPTSFTIDFTVNRTANWTNAASMAGCVIFADSVVRDNGIHNVASDNTEDGYSIQFRTGDIRIYRFSTGSRTLVSDVAITLASGSTKFRIRVNRTSAVNIKIYQETTLRNDYNDPAPPALIGNDFVVGADAAAAAEKAHIGRVTIFYGDIGAP